MVTDSEEKSLDKENHSLVSNSKFSTFKRTNDHSVGDMSLKD